MNIPKELLYTKEHEWVSFSDDTTAKVGITDFAQHALGDIVYINLPNIGDEAVAGESFADVESVKAISDIFSPVNGTINDINMEIMDSPEKINENPYGAWLVEISDIADKGELMSAEAYEELCKEED